MPPSGQPSPRGAGSLHPTGFFTGCSKTRETAAVAVLACELARDSYASPQPPVTSERPVLPSSVVVDDIEEGIEEVFLAPAPEGDIELDIVVLPTGR